MGYNEFIRAQTISILETKALRMADEIDWLVKSRHEPGDITEIQTKRMRLQGLRRRITNLKSL